jgi:hypothetical protein
MQLKIRPYDIVFQHPVALKFHWFIIYTFYNATSTLAALLLIGIFIYAYFGTNFILKHVLLKFILALQCDIFLLQFI